MRQRGEVKLQYEVGPEARLGISPVAIAGIRELLAIPPQPGMPEFDLFPTQLTSTRHALADLLSKLASLSFFEPQ